MSGKTTLLGAVAIVLMQGCAASKYPNWQFVRIEHEIPSSECVYRLQESCSAYGAKCYDWYKKRATIYEANTVVITEESGSTSISGVGSIVTGGRRMTALADYYWCPRRGERQKEKDFRGEVR